MKRELLPGREALEAQQQLTFDLDISVPILSQDTMAAIEKHDDRLVETYSDNDTPSNARSAKDVHEPLTDAEAMGINEKAVLRKT